LEEKVRALTWVVNRMTRIMGPERALRVAGEFSVSFVRSFPPEERVKMLHCLAKEHLGEWLEGMSEEEKAKLMNSLLPLVAKEFPLAEIDILGAFSDFT